VAQYTKRTRILFAHREQNIRLTLPRILVKHGFDITSVASVEDAVTETGTEHFDVLLYDVNLAEPNRRFAVLEAMRRAQPACVNFILTGDPPEPCLEDMSCHGVTHSFRTSASIDEMVNMMHAKVADAQPPSPS
jgi:DNA-binding NtrC family response regulator